MSRTTPLQDAYAPAIRRREEIVARDYCGGTRPTVDDDDGFHVNATVATLGKVGLTSGIAGGAGYVAARVTNTVMAEITINGQSGGTIDPVGFAIGITLIGLLIAGLPYLPRRVGR